MTSMADGWKWAWRETEVVGEKPVILPGLPLGIPHWLLWSQTRTFALWSRSLITWATTAPENNLMKKQFDVENYCKCSMIWRGLYGVLFLAETILVPAQREAAISQPTPQYTFRALHSFPVNLMPPFVLPTPYGL
jgi:hypothetical protein